MQINLIMIHPIGGPTVETTLHPLGEFPWMEEAELRQYLARCRWNEVPASQFDDTKITEGLWEHLKIVLYSKVIKYLPDERGVATFLYSVHNQYCHGLADHNMALLVVGQKPALLRVGH